MKFRKNNSLCEKLKKLSSILQISFIVFSLGCSNECENQNPTVILANNGTGKADIQIKTSGGNTENINNIEPGSSSEKRSFAPGTIEFTISIQGVDAPIEYAISTSYCNDYTVTINVDNTITHNGVALDKSSIPSSI